MYELIFYLLAVIIIGSAAVVAFSKNVMYAAFSLLFTFFGVAGLYVLLLADFIAVTQIMVYIGGILILILFGVMMTHKIRGVELKTGIGGKTTIIAASVICAFMAIFLSIMYINVEWISVAAPEVKSTIYQIGEVLLTKYVLAFEAAAVLLLIAFIGAALIARRPDKIEITKQ